MRFSKFLLTATFIAASFVAHAEVTAPYTMSNAMLREAPSKIAAAYITINNPTAHSDTLIGATADWADHIELHKVTANENGVMQMSPVKEIALPAHGKAELKQGGYHLMIFGVKEKLAIDQKKDIKLVFKKAGILNVPFDVQPIGNIGQQATKTDHNEMKMDHGNMPGM